MSENRLIDLNALGIGKCNPDVFENRAYADGWNAAIKVIETAPTVDAVEAVRCKDCKFWDKQSNSAQGRCILIGNYPTGNWFCANGAKMDWK